MVSCKQPSLKLSYFKLHHIFRRGTCSSVWNPPWVERSLESYLGTQEVSGCGEKVREDGDFQQNGQGSSHLLLKSNFIGLKLWVKCF